ncbi:MAG: right-handed parallel beta-helix repeat-containing protein [Acidimicrobiia bacterium]
MRVKSVFVALAVMAGMVGLAGSPASADHAGTTVLVDGADATSDVGGCGSAANPCNTIQAGVDHANAGDTLVVAAGTYPENVVLNKQLTLDGAQVGVDARGRVASESIIAPAAGRGIELRTGSAGSTIDGFSFASGGLGGRGIESTSGPINGLSILNSLFTVGGGGSAIFLNDNGTDITVDQNSMNGAGVSGTLMHLDQDNFDGFWFTNNDVLSANGTGLFSDGNRNVGVSGARSPDMSGNRFDGNVTGANLGRKSWEFASIDSNTFSNNAFPGLQGGPADSTITSNTLDSNGRGGLELTGFGGAADATRGAQRNTIEFNVFTGNGEAIFYSSGQAAGTISTNVAHNNNIAGNTSGVSYAGAETIDVECNWWGDSSGPSGDGPGSGDSANAPGTGAFDFEPWLTAPAPGGACNGPLPIPTSQDDCKKNGWMTRTDDTGRPFKNQGDCVSYVATGGQNKADG